MGGRINREVNIFNKSGLKTNDIEIKKNILYLWKRFFSQVKSGYVNFILTCDDEIKKLNSRYLSRDRVTDVISFYYHDVSRNKKIDSIEGDVFISVPQARRQAKMYRVSLSREVMLLSIHGFLHILGYRDYNAAEKRQMRMMENRLISAIKIQSVI